MLLGKELISREQDVGVGVESCEEEGLLCGGNGLRVNPEHQDDHNVLCKNDKGFSIHAEGNLVSD